jgi:hypothetical protein
VVLAVHVTPDEELKRVLELVTVEQAIQLGHNGMRCLFSRRSGQPRVPQLHMLSLFSICILKTGRVGGYGRPATWRPRGETEQKLVGHEPALKQRVAAPEGDLGWHCTCAGITLRRDCAAARLDCDANRPE